MEWTIRLEQPGDAEGVAGLTRDAFTQSSHGYHGEAELVEALRSSGVHCVSLVAVHENQIVGHVLFSRMKRDEPEGEELLMGLAPMSVHPQWQRKGIGRRLIQQGMAHLRAAGVAWVFVLGDPSYYGQFGFQAASEWGFLHGFAGIPQGYFLARNLKPLASQAQSSRRVYYTSLFGPQHLP